jgi:hypothetical protein
MSKINSDTIDKIIDSLSSEPCYIVVVISIIIIYLSLQRGYKHIETLEDSRLMQLKRKKKRKKQ